MKMKLTVKRGPLLSQRFALNASMLSQYRVMLSCYPSTSADSVESCFRRVWGLDSFSSDMTTSISRSRLLWTLLTFFAVAGFGSFMFPAFIIRPFRYQNPRSLWWAMAVRQRSPIISLVCAPLRCLRFSDVARQYQMAQRRAVGHHGFGHCGSRHVPPELFRMDVPSRRRPAVRIRLRQQARQRRNDSGGPLRRRSSRLSHPREWLTTTSSTTSSAESRWLSPIERSVTPVWCGREP